VIYFRDGLGLSRGVEGSWRVYCYRRRMAGIGAIELVFNQGGRGS